MTGTDRSIPPGVLEIVVEAKDPIGNLGGWWMTSEEEELATVEAGLADWQLYFLARHGVLGDVDPDVVAAAAYVFPPDIVRRDWNAARERLTPEQAVDIYTTLCHQWGRENLSGFGGSERLVELAERVIDSVDVAGLPLFAGWRALPIPTDLPARLVHAMQLMREHRGSCHGVALVASQMAPLMAILTNQGGADNAVEYGWEPPFPPVTDKDRVLRSQVEELTDRIVATAYTVLDDAEGSELLSLLLAAAEWTRRAG